MKKQVHRTSMSSTKQYVEMVVNISTYCLVEGIKILMESIQCHSIQKIHTINCMISSVIAD